MSLRGPERITDSGQQAQQSSPLGSESKGIIDPPRISDQAWEALARAYKIAQNPKIVPVPAVYDGAEKL